MPTSYLFCIITGSVDQVAALSTSSAPDLPAGDTLKPQLNGTSTGPMVGPEIPQDLLNDRNESGSAVEPQSERAIIRELTMPPIPNFDIPPSPPGSPDPVAEKKFKHFLDLKSQGVHFNEKLASSSSLKNPSLLTKLMEHAGIAPQDAYSTSLPTDVWDPLGLPSWAFKEELLKSSQEVAKREEERRGRGQRDAIDFVPGTASGDSSRGGTPGTGKSRVSASERIIAGLSRESTKSPAIRGRESRFDKDRPPSPKRRRRSRSR